MSYGNYNHYYYHKNTNTLQRQTPLYNKIQTMYFKRFHTPLGTVIMATSDGVYLEGLWFEGQKHFPCMDEWQKNTFDIFEKTTVWLNSYFSQEGKNDISSPAIKLNGTDFQKLVWNELTKIPYGKTTTYGNIAKNIDCKSAQAVGGAVGRNPISLIIPCHRVMGANGSMTGYAGGLERKSWLIKHEKQ